MHAVQIKQTELTNTVSTTGKNMHPDSQFSTILLPFSVSVPMAQTKTKD